jgi:hypothetical protein
MRASGRYWHRDHSCFGHLFQQFRPLLQRQAKVLTCTRRCRPLRRQDTLPCPGIRVAFPHLALYCKQISQSSMQIRNISCNFTFALTPTGLAYESTTTFAQRVCQLCRSQSGRGSVFQRSVAGPHAHSRLFVSSSKAILHCPALRRIYHSP